MSIVSLVICHVDAHRVIPHGFHIVNSHVSILLLVAKHRIFTYDKCKVRVIISGQNDASVFARAKKRFVKNLKYCRTCMKTIWKRGEILCTNVNKWIWEPANKRKIIAIKIIPVKLKEAKWNIVSLCTQECSLFWPYSEP